MSGSPNGGRTIDCDVHCAPESAAALAPYLSEDRQEYVASSGIKIMGLPVAYPPGAPTATAAARDGAGPGVPSTLRASRGEAARSGGPGGTRSSAA